MASKSERIRQLRIANPTLTLQAIADVVGTSRQYVHQMLREFELETRRPKRCIWCGKPRDQHARRCRACSAEALVWQNRAIAKVAKAVRCGDLPKASSLLCVDCGRPATGYEHRNYAEPLNVEPICQRCNSLRGHSKRPF